jgi:hypothetical protein
MIPAFGRVISFHSPGGEMDSNCVAVVGPANAGKTTLLHQLDEKLQRHLDSFLVLKGNPDGTGRYLYHTPELRNQPEFKKSVKGQWGDATIERICEWITQGRRNLSLALLDFGGRHDEQTAEGNARMLQACSHYLVVSRDKDLLGAELWDHLCRSHGLIRVGWMRSVPLGGSESAVFDHTEGGIEARFHVDILPGNPINDVALTPLVEALLRLSRAPDRTPYVNLALQRDWRTDEIADVGGQAPKIAELASRTGVVVLGGGHVPVWGYLAGLQCALKARHDARVFFYDPKQPERLVEIPLQRGSGPDEFPRGALSVSWKEDCRSILQLEISTTDKFLPPVAAQNLAGAPPPGAMPTREVALWGPGCPLWLFGAYARWLSSAGAQSLASWDMRTKSFVQAWALKSQLRSDS